MSNLSLSGGDKDHTYHFFFFNDYIKKWCESENNASMQQSLKKIYDNTKRRGVGLRPRQVA